MPAYVNKTVVINATEIKRVFQVTVQVPWSRSDRSKTTVEVEQNSMGDFPHEELLYSEIHSRCQLMVYALQLLSLPVSLTHWLCLSTCF